MSTSCLLELLLLGVNCLHQRQTGATTCAPPSFCRLPPPMCRQWPANAGAMAVRRCQVNRFAVTAGASTSVTTLVQRRARHRRFAACPPPMCRQWPTNAGAMAVRRRRVNRCAATAGASTSVTTLAQRRTSHRWAATSPPPLCPRALHHRRCCRRRATGESL